MGGRTGQSNQGIYVFSWSLHTLNPVSCYNPVAAVATPTCSGYFVGGLPQIAYWAEIVGPNEGWLYQKDTFHQYPQGLASGALYIVRCSCTMRSKMINTSTWWWTICLVVIWSTWWVTTTFRRNGPSSTVPKWCWPSTPSTRWDSFIGECISVTWWWLTRMN